MTATIALTRPQAYRPSLNLLGTLVKMTAIYRQRRQLAQLDDTRLADLGITRAQAMSEANRSVWEVVGNEWNVPAHWLRRV